MNSPTEDDTFKRLKSITRDEAELIYCHVYMDLAEQANRADGTSTGIPISMIRDRLDPELLPYGWSFDKLFPIHDLDLS